MSDVIVAGVPYSSVPSVRLPKQGGGFAIYSEGGAPAPTPTPWVRPSEWPDLGSLTLEDGELYITYDTNNSAANCIAALYVVSTGGYDWVRGHVVDGEFVPSGDSVHQNTKTYLRDLLPEDETGYIVYKVTGTITQWYFSNYLDLISTADTNWYVQPALEVRGKLPALTTLAGGYASSMVTSFTESWEMQGAFKPASMASAFSHGYNLRRIAAPGLDTSNTTSFASTFINCLSLESIDIPVMPTSKCTTVASMFANCYSLLDVDVTGWDTSKCTTFATMFQNCMCLRSLDLSPLDTSSSTTLASMFTTCNRLESIDMTGWDTGNVTTMASMFQNCSMLKSVDMHGWDVTKVTTMASMFQGCTALESVDISGLTIGTALTTTASMFNTCHSLQTVDVSSLRTPNVTTMASMFNACWALKSVNLTNIKATKCTTVASMFSACYLLETVDVSKLGISSLCENTSNMFSSCYRLRECPEMTAWNLSGIATLANGQTMFRYCYSLFEVTVPATLAYISNLWWGGNAVMGDVHMLSTTPPSIGATPFGSNAGVNVYVPASAVNAYKSAWTALAARIFAEP